MSALTFEIFTRPPGVNAGPTTMTSFEITGGELFPMRPVGSSGHVEVELLEQVDDAALPEALDRPAGLRIERDELETRGHEDDALFLAVAPVSDTAMHLAWGGIEARTLFGPPRPERLAGARIGRDHGAPLAGGEVQLAANHERRRLRRRRLRRRSVVVELPGPGDLEGLHVVARDLVERGIARAGLFGAVGAPLAVLGPGLSAPGKRPGHGRDEQRQEHESTYECHRGTPLNPGSGSGSGSGIRDPIGIEDPSQCVLKCFEKNGNTCCSSRSGTRFPWSPS